MWEVELFHLLQKKPHPFQAFLNYGGNEALPLEVPGDYYFKKLK